MQRELGRSVWPPEKVLSDQMEFLSVPKSIIEEATLTYFLQTHIVIKD